MTEHVVAKTTSGEIHGIREHGINVFKGIPYGGPVDGHRRFMPPTKPEPWTEVRDAFGYGLRAMQDDNSFALPAELLELFAGFEPLPMSENCLFLNIWTPGLSDGRKRPVMFWCHGGAFIAGSGSSPWYTGTNLAQKGDVVVVTINHRLGAFGYLHLEDLGGAEFASSGSAGMLDIIAALEWVRDNIASFGGDPGNVTIFGESGGGAKVSVLMAMPAAQGLFHKAIIQSGPAVQMASREDGTETVRQVLAELGLGAGQLPELRKIPGAPSEGKSGGAEKDRDDVVRRSQASRFQSGGRWKPSACGPIRAGRTGDFGANTSHHRNQQRRDDAVLWLRRMARWARRERGARAGADVARRARQPDHGRLSRRAA